jgi:atypical dual specificity phosphatase
VLQRHPQLGLVIDLTNTNKYYDPNEFRDHGVYHVKLSCRGHTIPTERAVRDFARIVTDFNEDYPNHWIGVHCTHGVNRTGYMVCNYLIQRFGMDAETVIRKFEQSRRHAIERSNYIDDLYQLRSNR